ncbi:MAG: sporulation protein YabP [Clostridia bacterium]|nr:sporulation protein YabP [Clostridia bacterium]MBQ8379303.1 sporulation protein YabP [Clostridia bacterium]
MEDKNKTFKEQNIVIQNREKAVVTGVEDIHSFDDELVIVQTDLGLLTIKGENLKMNKLNLDNNELIIEGKTSAIAYSDAVQNKKQGLMNKLFK